MPTAPASLPGAESLTIMPALPPMSFPSIRTPAPFRLIRMPTSLPVMLFRVIVTFVEPLTSMP